MKIRVRYILRCLFFYITEPTVFKQKVSETGKDLIIVHTDAIGDYILFRNFMNEIKKSSRFADHKITLVANSAYKNLAEELDTEIVDRFIWFDRGPFQFDRKYRKKMLREIAQQRFDIAINPTFSRDFIFADSMMRCINANQKIGQRGNAASGYWFLNALSSKWYTKLIDTGRDIQFEFERTRSFTEVLIEAPIQLDAPYLTKSIVGSQLSHIILFPGAGEKQKQWSIENFAQCVQSIGSYKTGPIYVCGGPGDFYLGEQIKQLAPGITIENLCGKTSLMELCKLIGDAELLITNDSSSVHIAACLNTPTICIGSGRHYGRFTPYPGHSHPNLHFLFPTIVENLAKTDVIKLKRITSYHGIAKVDEVAVERVVDVINGILKHENPATR